MDVLGTAAGTGWGFGVFFLLCKFTCGWCLETCWGFLGLG